ncbi:hypothetical protein Acsp06_60400 [Actinomycetospora sp. NBRC 106375]|nr:hypothetical protein Acsp06_60400 [Actinomycetospora sp. NBRC 106375]
MLGRDVARLVERARLAEGRAGVHDGAAVAHRRELVLEAVEDAQRVDAAQQGYRSPLLPYVGLIYTLPQVFNFVVSFAIFAAIGWPLLKDILAEIGVRPRLLWFRDVGGALSSRRQHAPSGD